ncbi:MAG: YggS family pyridoxal phosphate-dependent enzyme [Caldisericia bacterium]
MEPSSLTNIKNRIRVAAEAAGRDPQSVALMAVTKYSELADIIPVITAAEIVHIGENRIANAERWKSYEGRDTITLHMIGNLQRNKVRPALDIFDSIDTVDTEKLAERIDTISEKLIDVMIEVNISGEEVKHGCSITEFDALSDRIISLNHLRLTGVFTMCPIDATSKFRETIYNKASELACGLEQMLGRKIERSYGMSGDFELAIKCGATQVRIGRALFSEGR